MAVISISVVAGESTVTRSRNIAAPQLVRVIAALRGAFRLGPLATDEQVLVAWMDAEFAGLKTLVRSQENSKALGAAMQAQSDIQLT